MKIIKYSFLKVILFSLFSFGILFNSLVTSNSMETDPAPAADDKYLKQHGKYMLMFCLEWLGLCETGKRQSPINIVMFGNTINDNSNVEINYSLPKDLGNKKFAYDGISLSMDINLGEIKYSKNNGEIETYVSNKIELHFPAEHYITSSGQTPRAALEMQIYHTLTKTEGEATQKDNSEASMKSTKAVISILFKVGETVEGDMFLNQMGISKYNINNAGEYNIPLAHKELDRIGQIPASYPIGFNYMAFTGLLYILNSDNHIFFYYGSETSPPCREDVLWMVFSEYRSLSTFQFDFLNKLIPKHRVKTEGNKVENSHQLYGNKRDIKHYDEHKRGKILSSQNGLMALSGAAFFSEDPSPVVTA